MSNELRDVLIRTVKAWNISLNTFSSRWPDWGVLRGTDAMCRTAHTRRFGKTLLSTANRPHHAQPQELGSGLELGQMYCLKLHPNYHQHCLYVLQCFLLFARNSFSCPNSNPGFSLYNFFPTISNQLPRRGDSLLCLKHNFITIEALKKPVWRVNPRTSTHNQSFSNTKWHLSHGYNHRIAGGQRMLLPPNPKSNNPNSKPNSLLLLRCPAAEDLKPSKKILPAH